MCETVLTRLASFCLRRGRDIDGFDAHGRQQLKGQRKAERAVVDLVDKQLNLDRLVGCFELARELLVRELLAFSSLFDDGLGLRLVKRSRLRHGQAYMFLSVCAWYRLAFSFISNTVYFRYV